MKNKKIILYAILPVATFVFLGSGLALAQGWFLGPGANMSPDEIAVRHQAIFESQAQILGISADEFKNDWAEGKTLKDVAAEKGITQEQLQEKMRAAKQEQIKNQIKVLVDKGVITQTQADQRLQFMEKQIVNGKSGRGGRGGFHF